ncbi:tetracycline resistance monooxygenase [Dyadobacter koreensis]|uniref:Flavin-dependent monooxygenase n=1 Tax=Dyadobacter koreensis TaxID=408657 RepID=A0A1H6QIR0_9BACT|nr:NAD(P)/FAD-dependent oxidoreductase [Dyadobacter koreensis]SEI39135.1 tetracycline resistance monooxygenase [Dyadobacter koreensis]
MLLEKKHVVVIGAGPVGLTMAGLLQQKGIRVTVVERDKDAQARIWGGTLDLDKESGQKALMKLGLLERYFALAKPMGRILADQHGNVLFSKRLNAENQHDHPEISRNDLRTILMESLTSETVLWGRKFTSLDLYEGKWLLHFEGQPDLLADMVIGANGGMSKLRSYVADAQMEETGTYIIQGEVADAELSCPDFYQLCDGNILMSSYRGNLLVANPSNRGTLAYGITFQTPHEWTDGHGLDFRNLDQICMYLSARFVGWDRRYHQLFNATSFFVGLPTRKLLLDKPWNSNRPLPITLIGDAAHLMPPFAGKGVNTGLIDACVLAENLTSRDYKTPQAAIENYEQRMFDYASEAQRASSENELEIRRPDFTYERFIR